MKILKIIWDKLPGRYNNELKINLEKKFIKNLIKKSLNIKKFYK